MTKRVCPFPCTFTPQLKVHISEKEMCKNQPEKTNFLSDVHAKTLNKLYLGARNNVNEAPICCCGIEGCSNNSPTSDPRDLGADLRTTRSRQLTLGLRGQLLTTQPSTQTPLMEPLTPRCFYCEAVLPCEANRRTCCQCRAIFCQPCCLPQGFDGVEEISVCLSCAR